MSSRKDCQISVHGYKMRERKNSMHPFTVPTILSVAFTHTMISTLKIRTPKVDPSEVQFSDDRVPLFDIVEVEKDGRSVKDKQIRREFLKSFFECLSPRDKLIAMCIKDSGLDSGDILDLPLSLLRYQDPNVERIFIRMTRAKTSEIVSTFFSKETTKMIKNYERMNRTGAMDSESIFVQSKKEFKIFIF